MHHNRWSDFNFEKLEWRIPATRMKMRVQHIVPLSTQAVAIAGPAAGSGVAESRVDVNRVRERDETSESARRVP